jgi:hypothetical protein
MNIKKKIITYGIIACLGLNAGCKNADPGWASKEFVQKNNRFRGKRYVLSSSYQGRERGYDAAIKSIREITIPYYPMIVDGLVEMNSEYENILDFYERNASIPNQTLYLEISLKGDTLQGQFSEILGIYRQKLNSGFYWEKIMTKKHPNDSYNTYKNADDKNITRHIAKEELDMTYFRLESGIDKQGGFRKIKCDTLEVTLNPRGI